MTPEILDSALLDVHAALRPASGEAFAVIIDRLFRFAETFTIKDTGIREALAFYVEALDDIPPDLLERAVDGVVRGYKYGHRLPPPADLRAVVEDELARRINAKFRIETALKFGKYEAVYQPPTEEQKARVSEMMKEAKRSLTAPE